MKSLNYYKNALQNRASSFLNRHRGWTTNRKIIVIESDDWGSIRMPSVETLHHLQAEGVELNPQFGYDRYDTLASNDDLELLIGVLDSVKDKNNNPARMTLNTVMANPDFSKIKSSDYNDYHYELFTDTLQRYPNHSNSFKLLKEGIERKVFKPQFHAREHLNVQLWLEALQKNYPGVRESFSKNVFCNYFPPEIDSRGRFLEAYNIINQTEYDFVFNSIKEGLNLFENLFGFKSVSMIAPNYIWDDKIEEFASQYGIRYLQGGMMQRNTILQSKKQNKEYKSHYLGERNKHNQLYLTRNCLFEPSQNKKLNAQRCIKDIELAFKLKKPAVICSHRLNYIGELDKKNRDESLLQLKIILKYLTDKYTEIEFLSSDELGEIIRSEIVLKNKNL